MKQLTKILSKGEITKSAITELKLRGANVWMQNNLAVVICFQIIL